MCGRVGRAEVPVVAPPLQLMQQKRPALQPPLTPPGRCATLLGVHSAFRFFVVHGQGHFTIAHVLASSPFCACQAFDRISLAPHEKRQQHTRIAHALMRSSTSPDLAIWTLERQQLESPQSHAISRQEFGMVAGTNLQLRIDMWIGFCKMTGDSLLACACLMPMHRLERFRMRRTDEIGCGVARKLASRVARRTRHFTVASPCVHRGSAR